MSTDSGNLPACISWHLHVTEAIGAVWTDCTADSGVMFARLCHDRTIPAVHGEGDALRSLVTLSNPPGMNGAELLRALAARYDWRPTYTPARLVSLAPGQAAVVAGNMAGFPAGHRLRRWQPYNPPKAHAVLVVGISPGVLWWDDPLATGAYSGESITPAELLTFTGSLDGAWSITAPLTEADMPFSKPKAEDWTVGPKGALAYDAPGGKTCGAINAGTTIRTLAETPDGLWRQTVVAGVLRAVRRQDITPLVQGGDPAVDALLQAVIARKPPVPSDVAKVLATVIGELQHIAAEVQS